MGFSVFHQQCFLFTLWHNIPKSFTFVTPSLGSSLLKMGLLTFNGQALSSPCLWQAGGALSIGFEAGASPGWAPGKGTESSPAPPTFLKAALVAAH